MSNKQKNKNALKPAFEDKIYTTVALIILAIIMLIMIYPIWFVIIASFSNPIEIYQSPFLFWVKDFTLESYKLVFEDKDIVTGFRNSIFYTVLGTSINIIATICAAYPLSKKNFKGKGFLTFMFTFTMFFSGGLIPTYLLMDRLKLINSIWALMLPGAISMYNVIVMRTYFQTRIPLEIEEAAKVDGCTNFRLLLKIVLPLSIPIIAVLALYYGVGHWNSYFNAMIYLTDTDLYPLQLVLRKLLIQNSMTSMLKIAVDEGYAERMFLRMGLKYAVIVISTLPIFIVYPFIQKFFEKGVMVGSVKG